MGRSLAGEQICSRQQNVDVGQFADFMQFFAGELGLLDTTPGQDVHLPDRAGGELPQHMLGYVRGPQSRHRLQQHPGHVEGDIARPDDSDTGCRQGDSVDGRIRVPAVPGHQLGGRDAARKVLARHRQPSVGTRAAGNDHRVVVGAQFGKGDVPPQTDIAQETNRGPLHHAAELFDDGLDLRMIGRDPVSNQAVRHRQPVVQIDLHRRSGRRIGERLRRVDPGRSRPDDRNARGARCTDRHSVARFLIAGLCHGCRPSFHLGRW